MSGIRMVSRCERRDHEFNDKHFGREEREREKGLNQDQVGDELLNGIHTRFAEATDEPTLSFLLLVSRLCNDCIPLFSCCLSLSLTHSLGSGTTKTLSPFSRFSDSHNADSPLFCCLCVLNGISHRGKKAREEWMTKYPKSVFPLSRRS